MNPVSVIEFLCKRLIADIKKGPKAKTNKCERNWSSLPKCCIPSIVTTENLCKYKWAGSGRHYAQVKEYYNLNY